MRLAPLSNRRLRDRDSLPPRRGGKLYQFAGVGHSRLRRLQTCHHPGQLHCAVLVSNQNNSAGRYLAVVRFHHHIVPIRKGSNLCEMGDNNHLGVQGEPGEAATHLHRNLAANTRVDLVEDQSDGFAIGRKDHLQGQPDSRQFATRGDSRAVISTGYLEAELRVRHGQCGKLDADQLTECCCRLLSGDTDLSGKCG